CAVPVAAYATTDNASQINLTGLVISENGKRSVRITGQGTDALQVGNALAKQAIAQGADSILNLAHSLGPS
ncbi:MAG TPA: hypothetical protein VHP14_21215, partial [Anaerolineales bacterium]|nr:hypothetical protein [Anaerolineales bacterium]